MDNPVLADLEPVFIVVGISEPIRARYIGKSPRSYMFEGLKHNFCQRKGGGKLITVQNFRVANELLIGKRILIIE
jgi:hypothetical protein